MSGPDSLPEEAMQYFPSTFPKHSSPIGHSTSWFVRCHIQSAEGMGWLVVVSPFQVLPFLPPLPPDLFEAQAPSSSLPTIFSSPSSLHCSLLSTTLQSSLTQIFLFKKSRNWFPKAFSSAHWSASILLASHSSPITVGTSLVNF